MTLCNLWLRVIYCTGVNECNVMTSTVQLVRNELSEIYMTIIDYKNLSPSYTCMYMYFFCKICMLLLDVCWCQLVCPTY